MFHRQDLRKYISQLYFLQSTGRRGTFLSEEQICNCAVVPSHNANGIKVKFFKKEPEIKIGAALQIFLEKENVPLLPSYRETLYPNQLPHKSVPLKNKRLQPPLLNSNLNDQRKISPIPYTFRKTILQILADILILIPGHTRNHHHILPHRLIIECLLC